MHDYLHTKKEEDRKRKERKLLVVVSSIGFVAVCVGIVFLLRSPLFRIMSVSVDGAVLVDATAVRNELYTHVNDQGWLSRAILNRDSILCVDAKGLEDYLRGSIPAISTISVHKNFFARSVSISLQERERFGLWCPESTSSDAPKLEELAVSATSSTSSPIAQDEPLLITEDPAQLSPCWWFDKEGVAFLQGPQTQGHIIPKVIGRPSDAKIGDRIMQQSQMKAVLGIFDFLDLLKAPQRSLVLGPDALQEASTQSTRSFPTLRFSLKEDPHFALPVIEQMRSSFSSMNFVDLRVHNRIYYE